MAGLTRRRLYKPERRPARKKGILDKQAPISCPDASKGEIAMALFALCHEAKVIVGQGGEYDSLRDEYTVVGKLLDGSVDPDGMPTGKVQDVKIQGAEVGAVIKLARMMNGGRLQRARHG